MIMPRIGDDPERPNLGWESTSHAAKTAIAATRKTRALRAGNFTIPECRALCWPIEDLDNSDFARGTH